MFAITNSNQADVEGDNHGLDAKFRGHVSYEIKCDRVVQAICSFSSQIEYKWNHYLNVYHGHA